VASLAVGAEDGKADVLLIVVPPLLYTGIVRARSLAQEYRVARSSNHRRKSPSTELASQSTEIFCKMYKETGDQSRAITESVETGF